MRGKLVRKAIAVAVLSTIATVAAVAGQRPGLAPMSSDAAEQAVKPEAKEKVSPKEFNGDLRRIPAGKPEKGEARPEPQVPNEAPGAAQGDASLQTGAVSAAAPSPSASFDGLDYKGWGAGFPPDTNGDV